MSTHLVEWSAPRGGSAGSAAPVPILPIAAEEARRRPVVLAAVFALVALSMLALGLSTPKRYTSSTTMLVEDSNIIAPLMEARRSAARRTRASSRTWRRCLHQQPGRGGRSRCGEYDDTHQQRAETRRRWHSVGPGRART
ncbi:MAG: hypothetical protein H0W24_11520 [Lysobacter sp.]|nr:hypothetical protein [Lysobacter sp.]